MQLSLVLKIDLWQKDVILLPVYSVGAAWVVSGHCTSSGGGI